MYEAHFGLKARPFDTGIAHEVDVFRGARQNTIIDRTRLALAASDSVVTFAGPPGIGKTTLALAAVRSTSTRLALAWLSSTPTNANELLELLLIELGIHTPRASRVDRLQMWRQYLGEMSATDSRVFVISERTEELGAEVLRALDSLTGTDASGSPGANVVLLGHQGLDAYLAAPSLESLRQRIRLRQRVAAFSSAELTEYLKHRVTQAGGDFDRLFAAGAAAAVFRHCGGIARLANTLCETALTASAAAGKPALTSEFITEVAVDMLGLVEASAVQAPVPAPEAAAPVASPAPAPVASSPAGVSHAADAANARVVSSPAVAPAAPAVAPSTVTFTSVAIDLTPPKTMAVAVPKSATAAPRAETPAHSMPPSRAPMATPSAPPVATAAPTPAPASAPVISAAAPPPPKPAPVVEPAAVLPSPPVAAVLPAAAPPARAQAAAPQRDAPRTPIHDFEATLTDIPDVSSLDFPVLTDEVEDFAPRTSAARAPTPPSAPLPAAKLPATPPPARATSAAPPAPASPQAEDADTLHHTQTMRALSVAKSIDDVSDSMAETLFGEADLDFLSAALASAVDDGEEPASAAHAPPAAQKATAPAAKAPNAQAKPAAPPTMAHADDEFMDLFNLGPDAPLELIDDSLTPQDAQRRKLAARRS